MKKLIISAFILSLLFACNKDKDLSDASVILKHVVIQYNMLLAEGYRKLNMTDLLTVATEERSQKVYYHMSALGEARKKMDAEQKNISFSNIKIISPDRAKVSTREEWDYTHTNIDSGEIVSRSSVSYELTYALIKKNNKWLVSNIDIEHEETIDRSN